MRLAKIVLLSVMLSGPMAAHAAGIAYPDAPGPDPNHFINQPAENPFFYARPDGQPVMIQTDLTVNMTEALNRYYYNPSWRAQVWAPFETFSLVEKGSRMMATWPEYDEANQFRVFTGWHQFWERWTGYGP